MGNNIRLNSKTCDRPAVTAEESTAAPFSFRPGALFARFTLWVTKSPHALHSLSALRILYGFSILAFLATNFADRHYLWGVASHWVEPEAKRRGYWAVFRAVFSKDNAVMFDLAYVALAVLAVLFLIGWQTRFITPILLVFWVGLATNSTVLTNGGDTIMRVSLLFLVFANLSQKVSTTEVVQASDVAITMSGGDACPFLGATSLTAGAIMPAWVSFAEIAGTGDWLPWVLLFGFQYNLLSLALFVVTVVCGIYAVRRQGADRVLGLIGLILAGVQLLAAAVLGVAFVGALFAG